jgi:hypothetical protein
MADVQGQIEINISVIYRVGPTNTKQKIIKKYRYSIFEYEIIFTMLRNQWKC